MPRMGTSRCALLIFASLLFGLLAGPLAKSAHGEPAWPTYHRDAARSGNDPEATNPITPKLSWQSPALGAPIWSQPLVLGSRVYVATVGDEIYALDASTGKIIWEKSAGTPVPSAEVLCGDIDPTVGIVGTPVIDTSNNTLYAVADTWNATTHEAHHVLEGYNLTSGESVLKTPVDPPGAEPKTLLERPALTIDEGKIIFGFGGNAGDCGEYRGAVVAAPESGGPPSFWQYNPASPAYGGGAVWGTSGPAVDAEGHIYVSTGNPNFPDGKSVATYDDSDSVIELNSSMSLIGNFEPDSWLFDSNNDGDLSSSGPELLPGGLMFQAGKNEMGYLIDEATMGTGAPAVFGQKVCKGKVEGQGEGSFGGDAYAAGTIYVPCEDGVRALTYNQAARTFTALWHGPAEATGPPIVSGGLVWVVSGKFLEGEGTKLYGLDPATGAARFTETLPSPVVDHFASPSAAGGRVFVATGASVTAYQISQPATPPAPPTVVSDAASSVTQTTATMNGTVNPNGVEVSNCEFEYGTTISYGKTATCAVLPGSDESPVAVSAAVAGLAANTTYHYRIVAANTGGSNQAQDETFKTTPNPPSVVTKPASAIAQTTATLNGTVNPNGAKVTKCEFEYGTTISYGKTATCAVLPGSDESPVAVSAAVAGLAANTTYHYRIVAATAATASAQSEGSDETFKTTLNSPAVVTKPASAIAQTTATLNGTVNPNGVEVSNCEFEYGTTISYGKTATCAVLPGSGEVPVAVSASLPGLSVNTTYHYRIVAVGLGGTSSGVDETFKTLPAPPAVLSEAASSVTGASVVLHGSVNPNGGAVSECRFDYGTTVAYGQGVACSSLPGSGEVPVAVSASLPGLSVNTTYHYRISATGPGGTSAGVDEMFETLAPPPAVLSELVSSPTRAPATLGVLFFHEQKLAVGSLKLRSTALTESGSGTISVSVSCPAGQGYCRGTIKIRTLNAVAVGGQSGKATILTLAHGSFDLLAGHNGTLKLRLSAKARALIAQAHVLRASATIVTRDPAGATQSQTIVKLR